MTEGKVQALLQQYPGLQREDLCELNTEYSCSICAHPDCERVGTKGRECCPRHVSATVEQFKVNYLGAK